MRLPRRPLCGLLAMTFSIDFSTTPSASLEMTRKMNTSLEMTRKMTSLEMTEREIRLH